MLESVSSFSNLFSSWRLLTSNRTASYHQLRASSVCTQLLKGRFQWRSEVLTCPQDQVQAGGIDAMGDRELHAVTPAVLGLSPADAHLYSIWQDSWAAGARLFVSCHKGRQHGQDQVLYWHLWQKSLIPAASVLVASDTLETPGISLISSCWTSESLMWSPVQWVHITLHSQQAGERKHGEASQIPRG